MPNTLRQPSILNPAAAADYREALRDAMLIRDCGQSPGNPRLHPSAAQLVDRGTNLALSLAEICGHASARPGTAPESLRALGLSSAEFSHTLASVLRAATVGTLTAQAACRALCAITELPSYRDAVFPRMDLDVSLTEETPELGENPFDLTVADTAGATARVRTYGRNVLISRHVVQNDDIAAVVSLFRNLGAAAARCEAALVFGALEANAALGDGELLFHVDLGNREVAALSSTALGSAMARLRTQKTPAGQCADLAAKFLVVAPELELTARALLVASGIMGDEVTVVATPLLATGNWYLLADPAIAPVVTLFHLKGSQGVRVEPVRPKRPVDGVMFGARLDVGVAVVGRVGAVKGGV